MYIGLGVHRGLVSAPPPPPQIADFYGVGPGDITLRLKSSEAILDGDGLVTRLPNAGGAGPSFDLFTSGTTIPLSDDGAMILDPADWLRFSAVPAGSAPDLMDTSVIIVGDLVVGTDQYILGNGNPQSNVWLTVNGAQMRFSRRNPISNSFENVFVNLSPAVSTGKGVFHIEMLPGVPGGPNGGTTGGLIRVSINGVLRGSAPHPYPEFRTWNFASGQNPTGGTGLNAKVYDVAAMVRGGEHDARVPIVIDRFGDIYGVSV